MTNPGSRSATVGTAVSLQLGASGGTAPYTYTATGLPGGLSVNGSGLISGTPTTAGTYTVAVTAKDTNKQTGTTSFTWTVTAAGGTGGCSATGQRFGNPGFETGSASPWTTTPDVVSANGTGGETARSGNYFAYLDGYGVSHTDTLSQTVTIPAGCKAAFSFYLHVDTAETTHTTAYDTLKVTANNQTVATFSNLNSAVGYTQHTYDVSNLAGQTVTFTFTGTEDASLPTSFLVDDTALNLG